MYALILCGGSGTRLWPLSRNNYPKQFLKLEHGRGSLIQETFKRISEVVPADRIFFSTHDSQYWNVYNQIKEIYPEIEKSRIIGEPEKKNTAPAMVLGFLRAKEVLNVADDELCFITPADHSIENKDMFTSVLTRALKGVGDRVGIIGIVPTSPHTGYGYIGKGAARKDGSHSVTGFCEKPDTKTAEKLVGSGKWLWNGGIYMISRETLRSELTQHAPQLAEVEKGTSEEAMDTYPSLESISIDYAISEHSDKLIVYSADEVGWSDIGSFDTVHARAEGTVGPVRHVGINSKNITVIGTQSRLFATIGLDNVVIVENNDSTLVYKAGQGEDVKKLVQHLEAGGFSELDDELLVHRPWGKFEVLIDEENYKVKRISVLPGAKLSLQSHKHRAEHWVVVRGQALVVNGEQSMFVDANESVFIPKGNMHRLENPGEELLQIIEVQTGSYLGEDDIMRYGDVYARVAVSEDDGPAKER